MTILVGAPAQTETFLRMADEFHLWVDMTRWHAWMFRSIPNHYPPICAHCRNDIWVVWLISSLIHLSFVVDLLHNVESDVHDRCPFPSASSIAPNLLTILIVIGGIRRDRFWELHVCYLQVILSFIGSMRAYEKSMG